MYSKIKTGVLFGLEGSVVEVETKISNGLPYYVIVGLPNQVIRESKDRVKSAIKSCGFNFPDQKITQNMFPAHLKKEGAHLDLPIAMGIICCFCVFEQPVSDFGFIGELSLEGTLRPVMGALSLVEGLKKSGVKKVIMPKDNAQDVKGLDDIDLYFYSNLLDLVNDFMRGNLVSDEIQDDDSYLEKKWDIDFDQIAGQTDALRAVQIAAVGGHNILFVGPPGCGKSMVAERIKTVLPDLTPKEQLEVRRIKSLTGDLDSGYLRPVCMPHHSVTVSGMIGGTSALLPGVITKAHKGILYLDEITEFKMEILESLREPLSNGEIQLTRNYQSVVYPADFMLVATMNPCKCGNHLSKSVECTCTSNELKRYLKKLSGPFLDRLELVVYMDRVDLFKDKCVSSSYEMRNRIAAAIDFGKKKANICKNFSLEADAKRCLDSFYERGKLSLRRHEALLRIAQSISFLEQSHKISKNHLLEAISYQGIERLKDRL